MVKEVLVIGSSQAGLQAAMDLAFSGIKVHVIESSPFMGKNGEYLFPDYLLNQRMLEILKHPNITPWTNTSLQELTKVNGVFQAVLQQYPRYVDLSKCTACGDCIEICPVVCYSIPGLIVICH